MERGWVSHVLGPNDLIAVVNANVIPGILMGAIMGFGPALEAMIDLYKTVET